MELIIISFAAALIAAFLPGKQARWVALLATVAGLAINLSWLNGFPLNGEFSHAFDREWLGDIHFKTAIDGISMLFVLLTSVAGLLIVLSTWNHPAADNKGYWALLLMMLGALVGVFTARDGLLFYVFWELALIPVWFICAMWGGENRIRITLKFFIYTFTGSLMMLASLIFMYSRAHSFDIDAMYAVMLDPADAVWPALGFFMAFAIKMPVFPFHTWQPDTYTDSPLGGTMLLSGIMLKMGVYGAIRWMLPMFPEALPHLKYVAIVLSVIGVVYASLIAIRQDDIKRLIAYSSIAHVGLIAAGLFTANVQGLQGALVQSFNHGVNIIGLFLAAWVIEKGSGTRSLSQTGGLAKNYPLFAVFFMLVTLGTVAVPLTNGFAGELLLLNGIYNYMPAITAVAGLTVILCAVYMFRLYQKTMFGPVVSASHSATLTGAEVAAFSLVGILIVVVGVYPQPLFDLTAGSVNKVIEIINQTSLPSH